MKFKIEKSMKISTAFALTTSFLVTTATLGVTFYALFFVQHIFSILVVHNELYNQLMVFNSNLQRLVFAFLVLGLIASYYMTKIIINPLLELIKGTQELSKGNFNHRLKKTGYLEVNELVDTYNKMAENLEALYNDLESKVKERTEELENTNKELKNAQAMMVHSEKMRSLGQLVAGITHEINNPINFIYGNMIHLKNYSDALFEIISMYESFEDDLSEEKKAALKELKEKIDLNFLKKDLPMLIASCHEGVERTKNIIMDLKNFSRLDEMVINDVDLKKELDTTLNILHNKIKNRIEVEKDYEDNIPTVEGYGGQLNQVFMNILDNACYSIKDKGKIFIKIQKTEKSVIMEFKDTGCGMEKEELNKVFDPFYTTKPVGEGTGLGLSISYKVIQNHSGTITVDSEKGKGSTFRLELPFKITKD